MPVIQRPGAFPFGGWFGRWLESIPKPLLLIAAYALLGLIVFLDDRATPARLTLLMYYLGPIVLVSWSVGPKHGLTIAALAGALNLAVDIRHFDVFANFWDPLINDLVGAGVYLIAARAVSLLRSLIESEQTLARTDPGTGAANRRAFFERADYELERTRRDGQFLTVVSLDLDNFKTVNDRQGHAAGDAVLQTVADILKRNTRGIDLVARLGGDEFALLLPGADPLAAQTVVTRMQNQLRAAMAANAWPVSFSIGVVTFAAIPDTASELIQQVDELMYEAKNSGKDRVIFRQTH